MANSEILLDGEGKIAGGTFADSNKEGALVFVGE